MKNGDEIRVGHTPDMDDAFMFYALNEGKVPLNGFRVEHVIEDIQALNRRALNAELDITAISAAAYPSVAKRYWILSVGSSIGQGYGPLVISKQPLKAADVAGRRVAVPGLHTTACVLLRLAIPEAIPVELRFEEIPQAILSGQVEAGVVIHEWQLTYRDAGLVPVLDLGMWWQREVKLPLPLGLNVVKRSLKRKPAARLAALLKDSILYAFAHRDDAVAYAMRYGRGTDLERAKQFIGMYVNEESLTLSKHSQEALRELFRRSHRAELIPDIPKLRVIHAP
jgi:1,4-dihydroxy-6-naphthoate synthase